MSDYSLNSSLKKIDNDVREEILQILNKEDIWIKNSLPAIERLGWIEFNNVIESSLNDCSSVLKEIKSDFIIFIGMGGSIQTGKVIKELNNSKKILFIDSTHPLEVKKIYKKIILEKCTFIIMSKSGSTLETEKVMNFYINQMKINNIRNFEKKFIAITDKGTKLEKFALKSNFLKVITTPENIGGRFSSSTAFGVMPFLLASEKNIEKYEFDMDEIIKKSSILSACLIHEIEKNSFNKICFKISNNLSQLGIWLEQLISESSGKGNKGVTPIISNLKDKNSEIKICNIRNEDEILLNIRINNEDILKDMFIWQIAISFICKRIKVFPFDEPDVQSAKLNTMNLLKSKKDIHLEAMQIENQSFSEIIKNNLNNEILYINLYLSETENLNRELQKFKLKIKENKNISSISGYGPRYLHSVGQLQKGGPKNIWSIFIYDKEEFGSINEDKEYDELKKIFKAQLIGDFFALKDKGINTYLLNIDTKLSNPFDNFIRQIKE